MITYYDVLIIIFVHFLIDFCLQTEQQALNKSKNVWYLLEHVSVYSILTFIFYSFYFKSVNASFQFMLITFVCHFITDYFTSKQSSRLYKAKTFYGLSGFWTVIAIDQFLHIFQLLITFKIYGH